MLKKNTFNYKDFTKLLLSNIRFMQQLEKDANIIDPNSFTLVPMHKLTSHKLILEEIKTFQDIAELPEELLVDKFAFVADLIKSDGSTMTIAHVANKPIPEEYKSLKIKLLKIRYIMLFDASSKEHQKQGSKVTRSEL